MIIVRGDKEIGEDMVDSVVDNVGRSDYHSLSGLIVNVVQCVAGVRNENTGEYSAKIIH